jgi:16S rRNA (guanine527-N7)-methyltransferase
LNSATFREVLSERARIADVSVDEEALAKLETYFELLSHWNKRINLTSLPLEPLGDRAVDRLFIEPLLAAPLISPNAASWFDLGSGGGSPAFPLRIVRPVALLSLVESRERKAAFLREVIRELKLPGTQVLTTRIETLVEEDGNSATADLVTVRAVRMSAPLFSQLDRLLKPGAQAMLFGAAPQKLELPRGLDIQCVEPPLLVLRRHKL